MRCRLTLAALVAATGTSAADCPTRTDEMPATGFLASATRMAMEDVGIPQANAPASGMTAQVSAAGGMRADNADVGGTASVAAMLEAHSKGGLAGCASADLINVAEGSAHVTASTQIPLLLAGLRLGFSFDRRVDLPLAARGEYLRAPLSRIAFNVSIAFLDFEMSDEQGNHLRVQAMPFSVEQGLASQDDPSGALDRRTTELETAMFRFIASDATGSGTLDVFRFGVDSMEPIDSAMPPPSEMTEMNGFIRMSPMALSSDRERWGFELDGGWLGLAGNVDCKTERCYRGFYTGALRHSWQAVSVEGRAERTGFMTPNNQPAFEDRLTTSASYEGTERTLTAAVYGARVASWDGDEVVHRAGIRTTAAQQLGHGFSGVLDGELARADASMLPSSTVLAPAQDARVLLSLAWQKTKTR